MQPLPPGSRSLARRGLGQDPAAEKCSRGLPAGLRPRPDLGISRYLSQIPQSCRSQPFQQGWGVAISLVADDPAGFEPPRGYDALDQLRRQLMLGLCRRSRREFGSPDTVPGDPRQTRTQASTAVDQARSLPSGSHSPRKRQPDSCPFSLWLRTTGGHTCRVIPMLGKVGAEGVEHAILFAEAARSPSADVRPIARHRPTCPPQ
jgi:hypothetical protein